MRSSAGLLPGMVEIVSAYIVESGEFIRIAKDGDYYISKNPNYELSQITKRTSLVQRYTLYMIIGISMFTLYISWQNFRIVKTSQFKQNSLQEQIRNLESQSRTTDTVLIPQASIELTRRIY
jgi:hypothetical protein